MKKNILFFLLLNFSVAKSQTWLWAKSTIDAAFSNNDASSICYASNNNLYVSGTFQYADITIGTTTLTNVGSSWDGFIAKYDMNGNPIWARKVASTVNEMLFSVCTDIAGNCITTGYANDPGTVLNTTTVTVPSGNSTDILIAKYDPNGNVLWAKSFGGTGVSDFGKSVKCDASGNIYLTGRYTSSSISFGSTVLTNSGGGGNVFVAKFDSNGNVLWARSSGMMPGGYNDPYGITVDINGNACVTGSFYNPGVVFGTYTLSKPTPGSDCFTVKYDPNGNVLWAKCATANSNNVVGESISTDQSSNIYITGFFDSPTMVFGTTTLTNSGSLDAFVAKYDLNGNEIWARKLGGGSWDKGISVSTYSNGLYVLGDFTNWINIGTITYTAPSSSTDPMFLINYDFNGNIKCVSALPSGGNIWGGVCTDPSGNAYVFDSYYANPFIIGTNTLTMNGYQNCYLAKFNCVSTEIEEFTDESKAQIYPNPSNSGINIKSIADLTEATFEIIDALGKNVGSGKTEEIEKVKFQSEGIYFIILLDKENKTIAKKKIIITK